MKHRAVRLTTKHKRTQYSTFNYPTLATRLIAVPLLTHLHPEIFRQEPADCFHLTVHHKGYGNTCLVNYSVFKIPFLNYTFKFSGFCFGLSCLFILYSVAFHYTVTENYTAPKSDLILPFLKV